MKDNFYKYACLLLDKGLNIKKGQPLVITAPIESIEFIRVLSKCCLDRGIVDIYYDWFDDELKHQQLSYLSNDDISNVSVHGFTHLGLLEITRSRNFSSVF